jgi:hypothetical protein
MHGLCCTCAQVMDWLFSQLALLEWPQAHADQHCERLFLGHSLN